MYEIFEHTADLGLRVQAADLNSLFEEAGHGLFAMILANPDAIQPRDPFDISLQADQPDYLLFDWLNELLYRCETDHVVFSRFDVAVNGDTLTATVWGEPWDLERHHPAHEVKAITYHHLSVEKSASGEWAAELIVDI